MALKAVMIVGVYSMEILEDERIKNFFSKEGFLIIGKGGFKDLVSKEDILAALKGNIDSSTAIYIYTHGVPDETNPELLQLAITSKEGDDVKSILELINEANCGRPSRVSIFSCYSGLASKYVTHLAENSLLSTHCMKDTESFGPLYIHSIINSIKTLKNVNEIDQDENHAVKFLKDFLNNIALEMMQGGSISTWQFERGDKKIHALDFNFSLKEIIQDPLSVINSLANSYIEIFRPLFDVQDLVLPDLSSLAEDFRQGFFIYQCAHGKTEGVMAILEEDDFPEQLLHNNLQEFSPIKAAVFNKQGDIFKYLLKEKGVTLTQEELSDIIRTALSEAESFAIKLLHECGIDLERIDLGGISVVDLAIIEERLDVLKFLLDNGIKPKDSRVFIRALNYCPEALEILLDSISDKELVEKYGLTPMNKAVLSQDKKAIRKELRSGSKLVNQEDKIGMTPLHFAVATGNKNIVELLLNQKHEDIDANKVNHKGELPLTLAIHSKSKDIIKLLALHTDLSHKSSYNESFLDVAIKFGCDKDIIEIILNSMMLDPLFNAINFEQKDIVEYLLEHGADPNLTNKWGVYPLVDAARKNHIEIVKALLKHGADPVIKYADQSILDYIKNNNPNSFERNSILNMLEQAIWDKKNSHEVNELYNKAKSGDDESIEKIKNNPDQVNNYGYTALHLAALEGNKKMVEMLLGFNADHNIADQDGNIPLFLAAINNHEKIIGLLLPVTDIKQIDKQGRTILHKAVELGCVNLVKSLILREEIEVDCPDEAEKTPLNLAASAGHQEIVKLLLAKGANPYLQDECHHTSFMIAIGNKDTNMLEILVESSKDIDVSKYDKEYIISYIKMYYTDLSEVGSIIELIKSQITPSNNTDVKSSAIKIEEAASASVYSDELKNFEVTGCVGDVINAADQVL